MRIFLRVSCDLYCVPFPASGRLDSPRNIPGRNPPISCPSRLRTWRSLHEVEPGDQVNLLEPSGNCFTTSEAPKSPTKTRPRNGPRIRFHRLSTRGTSSWSARHRQPEGHLLGPLDIVNQRDIFLVRSTLSTRGTSSWSAQHRQPEGHLLGLLNIVNQRDIFLVRSTSSTRGTSSWSAQHRQPEGHLLGPLNIVTQRDFFRCPPNIVTFDIINDRDFFKCPPDIATRHRHPALSRIASQGSHQGSRQGTPHKDRFARIASKNASQGTPRKDRIKEHLTRIALQGSRQGTPHKYRFARIASQEPLHKNHFTRAASQAQNKFETLATSVQRIHHRKSKQLGETFDDFSVASWSLPRTSSPTLSSTPTSSFQHRHSDIVIPTSSFRHHHSDINIVSDINAVTDTVFCSSMAKDPRRGRDKIQKNLRAHRNLIHTQFGPSPTQQSPTHHRPRCLIEEAREDEATMSFIKPDDSVLLVRLKGEVYGYDT